MNCPLLYQWEQTMAIKLPSLNTWQRANVALFSYGVLLAESCRQDEVARQVSCGERVDSTTRRWRRFLDNSAFPLQWFFEEWGGWVTKAVGLKHLTLVVDETKLQDRLGIMVVGLAWENRCLPLAWRTYLANSKAGYPPEGQVGLMVGVEVLVLADRGIGTSPDLCRAVAALGWHYLFRVTCQTKIVTRAGALTIAQQVQPVEIWAAHGTVFKQRGRIPAQARALWAAEYDEPWALVTNDARLSGQEYARRNWQEQSFRDLKSGGWHWQASRVRQPDHLARLLVLLVIAYTWTVALGSQAVAHGAAQPVPRRADGKRRRWWSLFREGLRFFVEHVQRHTIYLGLIFIPDHRFT
jgi:Transposase DDE domain